MIFLSLSVKESKLFNENMPKIYQKTLDFYMFWLNNFDFFTLRDKKKSFWCQNIIRNVFRNIKLSLGYNFMTLGHVLWSIWQYIEKRPKYPIWATFWRGSSEDSLSHNHLQNGLRSGIYFLIKRHVHRNMQNCSF